MADAETIPLRVYNPGKVARVLQAGTKIGVLTPVKEVRENQDFGESGREAGRIPEHLVDLYEKNVAAAPEYRDEIAKLFRRYQHVFSTSNADLCQTDLVKHQINTGNASPIREVPRQHPVKYQGEIREQVADLLSRSVIEPTESPLAANIVLVAQKDGTKRFCVDYREGRLSNSPYR
ncbi:uncharacterized protein LOC117118788 [Anneissia japonica]|uniref:uncharacterized protein LOC117118788 n=1 Tax=Anneissia japonica TaxID=1529436 RepID=UPI0014258986|nr:uncharacterized protein LOC117118788 [Anneissia japonica]